MTPDPAVRRLGLPYARVDFDATTGEPVEVCPVCGAQCPMRTDATGETTASTYAVHYAESHEEDR